MVITANELKTKGVTLIDKLVQKYGEIYISIRGKKSFVVLSLEEYEKLKESQLDESIREAEEDYKLGRYK
ncbi:type II toxin-antitoxin system Phd/YefM family antitoxin, partial [Candidatus Desantisbacteria bacterium]|nr:type II toxin-antitoxin system Phd/YefM family antitoxin [Candidatus Desantisbacteria bacterium]